MTILYVLYQIYTKNVNNVKHYPTITCYTIHTKTMHRNELPIYDLHNFC